MNASEITFGIEIECYVPVGSFPVGGYHRGVQIPGFPEGWNAQSDGSLYTRRRGYMAVEVVSPVLRGVEGLRQVKEVVAKLKALGAQVNDRCGSHVHVGVGRDTVLVQKLTYLASNFQTALYAATGTKSRERSGYARPIRDAFRGLRFDRLGGAASARMHGLNLANLVTGSKQTVEFRVFSGTLNIDKIIANIRLAVAMTEKASNLKRPPKWDGVDPVQTSPLYRKGAGQTQLTRLFYGLGWIKGDRQPVHGNLVADDLPSIENSKRTLRRLARKYDAGQ